MDDVDKGAQLEKEARAPGLLEGGSEEGDAAVVPFEFGAVEGRVTVVVADGGVGAGMHEQLHHLGMAPAGCLM